MFIRSLTTEPYIYRGRLEVSSGKVASVKKLRNVGALTPMVANWLIDPHTGLDPITGWRIFFATGIIVIYRYY